MVDRNTIRILGRPSFHDTVSLFLFVLDERTEKRSIDTFIPFTYSHYRAATFFRFLFVFFIVVVGKTERKRIQIIHENSLSYVREIFLTWARLGGETSPLLDMA